MTGRSPSAATTRLGLVDASPTSTSLPHGRRRSATAARGASSSPSARLGRDARAIAISASAGSARDVGERRPRGRAAGRSRLGGIGRGRRPRRPRPAPPPGARSGARSSNSRKTSRSWSGRARARPRRAGSTSTGTSRMIVASCLEIRASSAWLTRFSLRLAPEISSTEASTVSRSPNCCSSVRGGLVADARDAGDVVRRVALEAVEVGDRLGRRCRSGR